MSFVALAELIAKESHRRDRPAQDWRNLTDAERGAYFDHATTAVDVISDRLSHLGAMVAAIDHFNASGKHQLTDNEGLQIAAALKGAWFYVTHGKHMYLDLEQIKPIYDAMKRNEERS